MPRIVTNTTYESFFWVEWNQVSQDIPGNKTKISWACGVSCGHSFYLNAIRMSAFTINGEQVYDGGTYSNYSRGDHTIASGTLDIQHDADGKKTFIISAFRGWLYSNHNYTAGETSHELPDIPRKATITESADFTDQDNPSITISNPGGFPIDVWLEPNPNGEYLCVRNGISLDDNGKYTWEIENDEREALRWSCPGKECTIRIGVDTHIGDTVYTDYRDKKFTMVESAATKPTVSMSIALDNGSLLSKFYDLYIQGKSRVKVTLSAKGEYGAGIQSLYGTMEGKTYYPTSGEFYTDVVRNPGNVDIVGYARDARGFLGEYKESITVIEYSKPLVVPIEGENAIQCYRSDASGNRVGNSDRVWIKAKRSYHKVNGKNTCSLRWRVKRAGDQWIEDTWEVLIDDTEAKDEFSALLYLEFKLDESYMVQVMAIDDIGEYDIKTFEIPTRDVALHLGKGGKNVAIGTYCDYSEDYTFYSKWRAIFDGGVEIGDKTLREYILDVINGGG